VLSIRPSSARSVGAGLAGATAFGLFALLPGDPALILTCAEMVAAAIIAWVPFTSGRNGAVRDPWRLVAAGLLMHVLGGGVWAGNPGLRIVGKDLGLIAEGLGFALQLCGLILLVARMRRSSALDGGAEAVIAGLTGGVLLVLATENRGTGGLNIGGAGPVFSFAVLCFGIAFVILGIRIVEASQRRHTAGGAAVGALLAQILLILFAWTGSAHAGGAVAPVLLLVTSLLWVVAALGCSTPERAEPLRQLRSFRLRPFVLGSLLLGFQALLLAGQRWRHLFPSPVGWVGALLTSVVVVAYLAVLARRGNAAEHRAFHDELTGLANRTLFEDRLHLAIDQARRSGTQLAVLFLDLDQFKNVNDSLGHPAGNRLLQGVARRLEASVRAGETVGRFGGDEFTVLLTEVEGPAGAATAAQRLLDAFAQPFVVERRKLFAGLSIGVAIFPTDGTDADTLMRHADAAMYLAKQRGRRRYELYSQKLSDRVHERLAVETDLHTAIQRGELELHYQPKVDLRTGTVVAVEALLRWNHPTRGLISPVDFIPVAEDAGLIGPLGEWVLLEACGQAQKWKEAGFSRLGMSVNLSPSQFAGPIDDIVADVLRRTGLEPNLLELEITEGLALESGPRTLDTLHSLRDMGVRLALDDFGTGYAALSYLTRWPIDHLKIDKAFVQAIGRAGNSGADAAIVVAILAMAKSLGLEVTGEGVETQDQLDFLRGHGCELMQGFLFSRAVPFDQLESILMLENIASGPGRLKGLWPTSTPVDPVVLLPLIVAAR
jgi:diguanylate cyclase (GGDEF)-like protein